MLDDALRISAMVEPTTSRGTQLASWTVAVRSGDYQDVKAGITYSWGTWKALEDGRRLNKGWEPLRRLPVTVTRTGYLIYSGDDGTEACLCSGKLKESFGDPFRLAVTIA